MSEIKSRVSIPYNETERFMALALDAIAYFGQIAPNLSNDTVLLQTIETPGLSRYIVGRLEWEERHDENPWSDDKLQLRLKAEAEQGRIRLPEDPVERERWLALVFIAAAQKEEFSYGNVVTPPDFLPEDSEEFKRYVKVYGNSVLEEIIRRRKALISHTESAK